jgi:hypothetical protein
MFVEGTSRGISIIAVFGRRCRFIIVCLVEKRLDRPYFDTRSVDLQTYFPNEQRYLHVKDSLSCEWSPKLEFSARIPYVVTGLEQTGLQFVAFKQFTDHQALVTQCKLFEHLHRCIVQAELVLVVSSANWRSVHTEFDAVPKEGVKRSGFKELEEHR